MSYSNNWLQSLKESYMAEAKAEFENHDDCVEHFKSNGMSAADAQRKCHALSRNEESRKDNFREEVELTNDLMAIIQALCEEAGVDMKELMEETRKEMENLGKASGWDKPAPAGAPHGKLAANARDVIVKARMAQLGKRKDRDALKTGEMTAHQIEMGGEDMLHEPTAKERAKGAPAARMDMKGYDRVQDSIEKISDKFTAARARREEMQRMMDAVKKSKSGKKTARKNKR